MKTRIAKKVYSRNIDPKDPLPLFMREAERVHSRALRRGTSRHMKWAPRSPHHTTTREKRREMQMRTRALGKGGGWPVWVTTAPTEQVRDFACIEGRLLRLCAYPAEYADVITSDGRILRSVPNRSAVATGQAAPSGWTWFARTTK